MLYFCLSLAYFTLCGLREISHLNYARVQIHFSQTLIHQQSILPKISKGHDALFPLLICVSGAADFVESYVHQCVDRILQVKFSLNTMRIMHQTWDEVTFFPSGMRMLFVWVIYVS